MCDPLTIAGVALSGASAAANAAAQSKANKARQGAMQAERLRQSQLQQEANAVNAQSQDRYKDFDVKQEENASDLTELFQEQATPLAAPADANTATFMPQSSSNITVAEEGNQRADARKFTDQQGAALGQLRSFGDLLGGIGREQARDAGQIGQIGGFMRGSSSVLPYELEAANSKGSNLKLFGDILGGAGSLATKGGISGGSIGSLFGGR